MLVHTGTTTLKTSRLVLRQFNLNDVQAVYRNMTSDGSMTTYLSWTVHESLAQTTEMVSKWIFNYEDAEFYRWGIEYEKQIIGSIHLLEVSNKSLRCELGYYIGSKWWNKGIATEASKEVIRFAFEQLGMHKITSWHHSSNVASGRVINNLGMVLEGVLRKDTRLKDGEFVDVKTYGLLHEEWIK